MIVFYWFNYSFGLYSCKIVFLQIQIHEKDSWETKEKRKTSSIMIDWLENRKKENTPSKGFPIHNCSVSQSRLSIANNSLWQQWTKNPQIRHIHIAAYGRSMVVESGYKSWIRRPIFQITNLKKKPWPIWKR